LTVVRTYDTVDGVSPLRIELVVTDLDGTLWGLDRIVHPRTLAAIEQLERWGVPVLAATARRSGAARRMLTGNGLELPAVLLDGALVRDRSWTPIHADSFAPAVATEVLAVFRRHGFEPCIGVLADGDRDARVGPRPSSHPDHIAYLADWMVRADLDAVVAGETVQSFSVCGVALDAVQPVADELGPLAAPVVMWDATFDAHTITVGAPGVDKWRGVQAFCAHHGIDDGRVLAVGDGLNDLALLDAAAIACVVAGSDPRVAARADHLVGGPVDGGWADVLAHVR
jgi:hydroxymethylpyrimidine pyrophosphatase-like HAD family hydrolase